MLSLILVYEAIVVGIISVIFGFLISYIFMGEEARRFQHWNRVLISYFITGVVIHLTCEFTGLNAYYCNYKK
jgi:hypothetical protein